MTWRRIRSKNVWNSARKRFELGLLEFKSERFHQVLFGREARSLSSVKDYDELYIGPAAIDLHVHGRDFEESHKESFETLVSASNAGGVATMVCMANTRPRLDHKKQVLEFFKRASSFRSDLRCFASVTIDLNGETPSDWDQLLRLPIVGLSDDGKPILNEALMLACLKKLKEYKKIISLHEEDTQISCGSNLHLSEASLRMGVDSSPEEAESLMVKRDLELAKRIKTHVHFGRISSKNSVALFRKYRGQCSFSAELTPHHALMKSEDILELEDRSKTHFKVCPVIRTEEHRQALLKGAKAGLLDCFATDHAPHSYLEKNLPLPQSAHGIVSLEYFYTLYLEVRRQAKMSWSQFFSAIAERPAEILGASKEKARIQKGFEASFVIFDPSEIVDLDFKKSKSNNSPLQGRRLQGKVKEHWIKGSCVYVG
ncbi:MAG: dihydroorotase [Bdellovibrionota bacterium]